jgi:hypothetical protein
MNIIVHRIITIAVLVATSNVAFAQIDLGTAGNYAVLAGSTVTNTGPSRVDGGHIGVSAGTAITGFGPGLLLAPYTFHRNDADATQAKVDLGIAYFSAANLSISRTLTGVDLGGLTLTPGVYFFASSAQLTGQLTLDYEGDPNAQFVFQIGSTLTTASNAAVIAINNGADPAGCSVFWQVGSSATIGTDSAFAGHILAMASITMQTRATLLSGSLLAQTGAVTLDSNEILNCIPAPSALLSFSIILRSRRRRAM